MFLVSSCSCFCLIYWSHVLSREWRCSWSSADRRCSNYMWVINKFIAYQGVAYIRGLTVLSTMGESEMNWKFQSIMFQVIRMKPLSTTDESEINRKFQSIIFQEIRIKLLSTTDESEMNWYFFIHIDWLIDRSIDRLIGFNVVLDPERPYMTIPHQVDITLEKNILDQFTRWISNP